MPQSNRLTHKELAALIGRHGTLRAARENVTFPIVVTLARSSYGRDEVEITPVGGAGSTWVNVKRVKLAPVAPVIIP